MKHYFYYETELGRMCIADNSEAITNILLVQSLNTDGMKHLETTLIRKAYTEICEYLKGKRKVFDLPIAPDGTEFQKKVWANLCEIPYGETVSYKTLAEMSGNPKACRAVGMANNRNPIIIVIPCHRVIGSDGSLTGYAAGLDTKRRLLQMEKENK